MGVRDLIRQVKKQMSSKPKDKDPLEQRFGLLVLSDPTTSSAGKVDLVAVHGLGGHPTRTWRHGETGCWLKDFIPLDIENARVMTYGYESAVAFSKSTAGIEEFARDLLERLKSVRQDSSRPIIFVCHSMGGLIVKKALIISHERENLYGAISNSTAGVIFLATPHRGSGVAAPAELASKLLRASRLGTSTNTKLVTSLRQNAEVLWDISSQFVDRGSGIQIRTFYETESLPYMNSLVVDKKSAVLHHPNEVAMPILNTNHTTISRFSGRDCQSYALVRNALKDLHSKAISEKSSSRPLDEDTVRIIQQFHKSAYIEYKASVQPPIGDTCAWFLDESRYVEWLQDPSSSLLWISGDPGCGKTTLAAFVAESVSQHLSSRNAVSVMIYFFFDGNIAAQSTGAALLSALIHQLLKANPHLVPLAQKSLDMHIAQLGFSLHNLCEVFRAIISDPERSPGGIICVVDALDECDTESMEDAIRFLVSIISSSANSGREDRWLKLAVTSRHIQSIDDLFRRTFPGYYQIRLSDCVEQTTRDIATFVEARCLQVQTVTRCSDEMRRVVEKQLIERSDNTFLWIHMVLDLLETNIVATPQSFISILRSIPDRLDELYDSILRRSPEPESLMRILSIIAASRRALTLDEINIALTIQADNTLISQVEWQCHYDIARYLYTICGPFISIRNGTVSFIHQTAAEFLMRPPNIPRPHLVDGIYQYAACLDVSTVNYCMAEVCVVYIMLADGVGDGPSLACHEDSGRGDMVIGEESLDNGHRRTFEESSSLTLRRGARGGGLFNYAAEHWGTHCRLSNVPSLTSGEKSNMLFTKVVGLCDTSTSVFCAWFQLYWDTISTTSRFPDGLTPLMLASHMGLLDVMRALLLRDREKPNKDRKGPLHVTDSEGWTVLHWAVWNGTGSHIDNAVLKLLLQYHDNHDSDGMRYSNSDENEIGDDNKDSTPHMKHQDARKKAQVLNIQDKKGLTALHWAAADDQEGAMRLLLDAGAAVDIFDAEGMTPLSLAVENKFLGPVELLIEYGADINATI